MNLIETYGLPSFEMAKELHKRKLIVPSTVYFQINGEFTHYINDALCAAPRLDELFAFIPDFEKIGEEFILGIVPNDKEDVRTYFCKAIDGKSFESINPCDAVIMAIIYVFDGSFIETKN